MKDGRRSGPAVGLERARSHAARELGRLPDHLRRLGSGPPYPVAVSTELRALARTVDRSTGLGGQEP